MELHAKRYNQSYFELSYEEVMRSQLYHIILFLIIYFPFKRLVHLFATDLPNLHHGPLFTPRCDYFVSFNPIFLQFSYFVNSPSCSSPLSSGISCWFLGFTCWPWVFSTSVSNLYFKRVLTALESVTQCTAL